MGVAGPASLLRSADRTVLDVAWARATVYISAGSVMRRISSGGRFVSRVGRGGIHSSTVFFVTGQLLCVLWIVPVDALTHFTDLIAENTHHFEEPIEWTWQVVWVERHQHRFTERNEERALQQVHVTEHLAYAANALGHGAPQIQGQIAPCIRHTIDFTITVIYIAESHFFKRYMIEKSPVVIIESNVICELRVTGSI
jgi:hypothetical protein